MVDIMRDVWKDLLLDNSPSHDAPSKLASPGELRKKILVKAKCVIQSTPSQASDAASSPPVEAVRSSSSSSSSDGVLERSQQKTTKNKILEALSRLAVYTKAFRFSSLNQPGESF